jgi:hypothetical protein
MKLKFEGQLQEANPEGQRMNPVLSWDDFAEDEQDPCRLQK